MGIADVAVSCSTSTSWMDNADGESPCTVANNLMLPCSGGDAFQIAPLSSTSSTYSNPSPGQSCSCNTVVYNLISACAVCQGASAPSMDAWMTGCSSVSYATYPSKAIADSYSTPQWAYVNVTGTSFDLTAVEKAAGANTTSSISKRGWSPIQIALPIIIAIIVAAGAALFFLYYQRRLKTRYTQIGDTQRQEYGHHSSASTSTLGLDRLDRFFNSIKRKPSRVAWEQANLQRPRRLGGLIPDRRAVHPRRRGTDWSIDSDMYFPAAANGGTAVENASPAGSGDGPTPSGEGAMPGTLRQGHVSSTSLASRLSVTALNFLGVGSGTASAGGSGGPTPAPTPGPTGEKGASRPLTPAPDGPLRPIQDDPAAALNASARPKPGVARGSPALPPVHVVAGGHRARGFHLDDVDSARSPTVVVNEHGRDASSIAEIVGTVGSSGYNGRNTQAGGSEGGDAARPDGNVVLISRTPGQDFNSMASPVETDGMGEFHSSSSEHEIFSAALSDASSVLPDNQSPMSSAFPRPPAYTPVMPVAGSAATVSISRTTLPASGTLAMPAPTAVPRLLVAVPPQHADPALLAPPVIRAAGGYSPSPPPARAFAPSAAQLRPQAAAPANTLSPLSATRTELLPNARLFAGSDVVSPASGFSWGYSALSPSVAGGPVSAAVTDISHTSQNSSTAATAAWSNSSQAPTSASVESTAGAVAMLAPRVAMALGTAIGPMTFASPSILSLASSPASIVTTQTPSSIGPPSTHSSDQYTVPNPFTFNLPRGGPGGANVPNPLFVAFQKQQHEEAQRQAAIAGTGMAGPELGSNNPFITRARARSASFDLDA